MVTAKSAPLTEEVVANCDRLCEDAIAEMRLCVTELIEELESHMDEVCVSKGKSEGAADTALAQLAAFREEREAERHVDNQLIRAVSPLVARGFTVIHTLSQALAAMSVRLLSRR